MAKPKQSNKPERNRTNTGNRGSRKTGDLLGQGLERKFFNACYKEKLMSKGSHPAKIK